MWHQHLSTWLKKVFSIITFYLFLIFSNWSLWCQRHWIHYWLKTTDNVSNFYEMILKLQNWNATESIESLYFPALYTATKSYHIILHHFWNTKIFPETTSPPWPHKCNKSKIITNKANHNTQSEAQIQQLHH